MPKFRKKPVVIEAEQYTGRSPWPKGVLCDPTPAEAATKPYVITAHNQRVYLAPGDWIIPESNGNGFYPCKPDIFAATYEPTDFGG